MVAPFLEKIRWESVILVALHDFRFSFRTQLPWLVHQSQWCSVSVKQCDRPGGGFTAHEPCMASTDEFECVFQSILSAQAQCTTSVYKAKWIFFQSYVKKRGLKALFCVINLMLSFLQLLPDRYLLHSTMKVYCTGWVKEGLFNNTAVLLFATCQVCYFILCHMCVYHYVNITL